MRRPLERFIRWVMRDCIYHRIYPAVVQGQNLDGSIEVLPDDDTIRGTGLRIPARHGIPGMQVDVVPGARCLIGFAAGDPTRPYVAEWESDGLVRAGFNGGTRPIARMGDTIKVMTLPQIPVQGTTLGTLTVPGTPPVVTVIPMAPFDGVATISTPVQALIMSGNPKLLA